MEVITKNDINHIGFIMDGNRRWAKKNSISYLESYEQGVEVFFSCIEFCLETKIKTATFYALSLDNINKRGKDELENIYEVAINRLRKRKNYFIEKKIRVKFIGKISSFSVDIQNCIGELEKITDENDLLTIFILSAYDGILDLSYYFSNDNGDINFVSSNKVPSVDVIIRTGNYNRLSGFLPLQSVYADIITVKILWPELNKNELKEIIEKYKIDNKKNYGK